LVLLNPPYQVSDGGVHSHITHLFALLETAKEQGIPHVFIHFFGDGRDTAPTSGAGYMKDLLDFISDKKLGYGKIGTVVGRYYAMDRDKRWERVKVAVDGLVQGEGEKVDDHGIVSKMEERYKQDQGDEFLKPIIVGGEERRIQGWSLTMPMHLLLTPCFRGRYPLFLQLSFRPHARTCDCFWA
jgi:2,3-bisphosphoglycerate-independent phosphoglycerate mutase